MKAVSESDCYKFIREISTFIDLPSQKRIAGGNFVEKGLHLLRV